LSPNYIECKDKKTVKSLFTVFQWENSKSTKPIQHLPHKTNAQAKKQTAQSGNILKTREFLLENPE